MKKALMVATVGGFICSFEKNDIKLLKNLGYEVFIACNTKGREEELEQLGCKIVHLPIARNPFKKQNIISYQQLKVLMEKEKFDLVHCHTPVGGVLARMAAKKYRKTGTKVIYTAHGFHFFKGAPLVNWLIYYPIERWLSRYTDILITINKEDYQRAKKNLKAEKVIKIPSVGLDTESIFRRKVDKNDVREQIQIPKDAFLIISVGELNTNKNHEVIIKAIKEINNENVYYILCGSGSKKERLEKLCYKLGIKNNIKFLGFRNDVIDLCKAADAFAFPSLREGLGMAALEGMAAGLPLITSNIHGINDYSIDGISGYKCSRKNVTEYVEAIRNIMKNEKLRKQMKEHNMKYAKNFDICKTSAIMQEIYSEM